MEAFSGTWVVDPSATQNMDGFLNAAGFPAEVQKEYKSRHYKLVYGMVDSNTIKLTVSCENRPKLGTKDYVIPLGKEFEMVDLDGEKTMCTVTWDGSKFKDTYKGSFGEFSMIRTVEGDIMTSVSSMKGETLTEKWKRC